MTFGINGAELIILILLAVLVLGPEKLPEYARKLTEWIRNLRTMAEGAKSQFKEETGTDFDEIDWKKYDPRQYDPRRIIRDALAEPVDGGTQGAAAASISGSSPAREGLRGDLDAARSQRDALRDDLKDMDPRALLFGPSSKRGGSRTDAATAATAVAAATTAPAEEETPSAPAADPAHPDVENHPDEGSQRDAETQPGQPGQPGPEPDPAPFDAEAT